MRHFKRLILLLFSLSCLGYAPGAVAQDWGNEEAEEEDATAEDGIATEGVFKVGRPSAYKIKVVRPGEVRTNEYFFTAEVAGSGTATALASDKAGHAGRFAGVRVHCVAITSVLCQVPVLTKNGTPITDSTVLRGGQTAVMPFADLLPVDTSDSIQIQGAFTTTGTAGSEPARVMYELYTPRQFQSVAGGDAD